MTWTTGDLARRVGATCEGPEDRVIGGVASLDRAGPDELSFCRGGRWAARLAHTRAGAALVPPSLDVPAGTVALRCADPRYAFALAAAVVHPAARPAPAVHPTAVVGEGAQIGDGVVLEPYVVVAAGATLGDRCWLQPFSYVGAGARLGAGCRLMPSAIVLEGCVLGDGVTVQPGAVIGADGFGHVAGPEGLRRVPHLGTVILEDEVEIGANSCVDRAALDETRIGRGTRADNLVQIAHGVTTGAECLLAAFAGLAGGATLADRVVMGGRSAVVDGVRVGSGAQLAGLASADRDVAPGARMGGSPARSHRRWLREVAALGQLPELLREVEALKRRLAAIEDGRGDE